MRRTATALLLSVAATACSAAGADGATGTLVAANCAPVAAASDGTMVWYARNTAGLFDAYIGNGACSGAPLLPAYAGHRGPADITPDGRYVLLTTAVGWDRTMPWSSPGRGSQNAIQLYDRVTGRLTTLLGSGTSAQRGVIWPKFNSSDTKIAWAQMLKTGAEAPPYGRWSLHVANVNLAAGTLSNNVEWQDPNGLPAFYEAYGWLPGTNNLIFMSTTRSTTTGFGRAQLFTLPDNLEAATAPTRVSPRYPSVWPWEPPVDVYHEFAAFAPGDPNTMYTSVGADTVGGDDLFSYDLRSAEPRGLLGPPQRISYFGGDMDLNWGSQAVSGWPQPSYTVVTTMAWVGGAWVATTCPDILCEHVNAWRISLSATATAGNRSAAPVASAPVGSAPVHSSTRSHAHKPARRRARSKRARRHTCPGARAGRHRRSSRRGHSARCRRR